MIKGFPGGPVVKNQSTNTGDTGDVGLIPGSGRFPGEGNGNLVQYSCLKNLMDKGYWQATVHEVTKESYKTLQLNKNNNNLVNDSLNT